jgi:NAD(P)H-flavin reductase
VVLTLPIREVLVATPRARIVRIDLDGQSFSYAAGQAVMVAPHGETRRRPYSIAIAPEEAAEQHSLELLVGLEVTGQSGVPLTLETGALVDVEGPIGRFTFPPHPTERRFLFVAGGTGVSPLRAMLHHALRIPHEQIGFLYSARTPDEFAYESELRALAAAGRIDLRQTITREAADSWQGQRGRIRRDDLARLVHATDTLCFVCGPPPLVQGMFAALNELGVERERIRIEEWGSGSGN